MEVAVTLFEKELPAARRSGFETMMERACFYINMVLTNHGKPVVPDIADRWSALLGEVLLTAISQREVDMGIICFLLDQGAVLRVNATTYTELLKFLREGSAELISELLLHGALKPDDRDEGIVCHTTPLMMAAGAGRLDLVSLLIDEGKFQVDHANITMQTALRCACSEGHVDVARVLMARYGANPIFCAGKLEPEAAEGEAAEGRRACFKMVKAVRSVTEAFRSALNTGDVEGLELLMEQGGWGLVNAVYLEGMLPPLTVAARQGDVAVARLLLAHGARPEMPVRFNIQGQLHTGTALSTAALGDNQEMVTLLLSQNPTAEQLQCALLCGCRGGDGLVMSALLLRMSYEMDVWVRALVTAAHYGSTSVVPLLLERVEDQEERQQVLRLVLAKEQGSSPEGLLRLVEPCMPVDLSQVLWRNVMEAACRIGALDTVKLLMDKGINTAEAATSGLRIALRLGGGYNDSHVRVARYLLKRRVPCGEFEPDKYGSMLRMVLDTGTDFSVGEALREGAGSIFNEFNESVASILERGVGFKPADVTSAILAAAEAGYAPTISQLRKVGVKPSMEDGQERARANAILLTACRNNTYRVVLELLKWGGVDVDARTEKGYTPIMMCLQRGDMLMVKRLLEAGADLDAAERQFDRLLQWTDALFSFNSSMSEKTARAWEELVKKLRGVTEAAEADDEVIDDLKDLVEPTWRGPMDFTFRAAEWPCVVNAKGGEHGWTVLMAAASKGHLGIVTYVLRANGIDIDMRDRAGKTALMYASEGGHLRVVRLLLEHGASVGLALKSGETAFTLAVRKRRTAVASLLLQHGAVDGAVKEEDGTVRRAVAAACLEGHAEMLDYLLEEQQGGRVTMADLVGAVAQGHVLVVRRIMQEPCKLQQYEWGSSAERPHHREEAAAYMPSDMESDDFFDQKKYFRRHAKEEKTIRLSVLPALLTAAAMGHVGVLRELLDATPPLSDHDKDRVLHTAIKWGNVECVQWLLKREADVPISFTRQVKLLRVAFDASDLPMYTILLDTLGPEVLRGCDEGVSLLSMACQPNLSKVSFQVAQLLVERGADVNLHSEDSQTPLMRAAATAPLVSFLLDQGADMSFRQPGFMGGVGCDAFGTACVRGRVDAVKVFLQHGAVARYRLAEARDDGGAKLIITQEQLMHGLNAAVRKADLEVVRGLLEIGGEVLRAVAAQWHADDKSPFYAAIKEGRTEVAALLYNYGSDTKIVRKKIDGAGLRQLCRQGKEAELRTMLGLLSCHSFSEPRTGQTPLMAAARAGKLGCVRVWLEHMSTWPQPGVLIDQQDVLGRTALWHACDMGHSHVAEVLVAFGANPACTTYCVIDAATEQLLSESEQDGGFLGTAREWERFRGRDAFSVAALRDNRACIKAMRNVMDAARVVYEAAAREEAIITVGEGLAEDRVATVSRLLNGYASFPLGLDIINAITTGSSLSSCYTILHGAAKSGDAPLVHTLLARGAWKVWNLEMLVPSPLVLAIRGGHEEIVELLMSPEVLKKHPHPSPMYTAAFYGHLGIVRRLIQTAKESDAIGASDIVNSRSLWVAIRNGHTEVALELAQIPEVYQAYLKSELSLVVAANNGGSIDCLYIVKRLVAPRLYWLHKFRALCHSGDDKACLAYVEGRVAAGQALPSVEVGEITAPEEREAGWRMTRGRKRRSVEEEREEEMAVAQHVVCHLQAPLFHRLTDLMAPVVKLPYYVSESVDPLPDELEPDMEHLDRRVMYFKGDMDDGKAVNAFRRRLADRDVVCHNDFDRDEPGINRQEYEIVDDDSNCPCSCCAGGQA